MKTSKTSARRSNETPTSRKQAAAKTTSEPRDLKQALAVDTLAQAREVAAGYTVVLHPRAEGGFSATALEFPTVFIGGANANECMKKMREALMVAVAVMLDAGETPPIAATEERRDQQINIRLTPEERLLLENAAKRRGFRGISDFVRSAALSQTRRSA